MELKKLPVINLSRKPVRTSALIVIAMVMAAAAFGGRLLIKSLQGGLDS